MKRFIFSLSILSCLCLSGHAFDVAFKGNSEKVLSFEPERSTGLNKVFVAYDASMINEMVLSGLYGNIKVYKYSNLGGAYAEEIPFFYDESEILIKDPSFDMGYIIQDSSSTYYIWLIDYLPHKLEISSISSSDIKECDYTYLEVNGKGGAINFYDINGRQIELSREIHLSYNNLEWDEATEAFIQVSQDKILNHLTSTVSINPPLYCNSVFDISGDRFLEAWGKGIDIRSAVVYANGVDARTSAVQTNVSDEDASNVIKTETQGMGGSAPVDIEFKAYTTDAVIHNEWQISLDESFEQIDYRFNEQNLDYTFNDEGTYFVRYIGSNSDGTCEVIGDTYTVGVGASELKIPNAFTPNGDGINDEWKVSYRSILSFSCTIFDRYGNQLFHFTDPSQGWDGKHKGKDVQPGVYFYVIEAVGADGKKYKKGGDINIIKAKKYGNTGSTLTE